MYDTAINVELAQNEREMFFNKQEDKRKTSHKTIIINNPTQETMTERHIKWPDRRVPSSSDISSMREAWTLYPQM